MEVVVLRRDALERLGDDVQQGGGEESAGREGESVREADGVCHLLVDDR